MVELEKRENQRARDRMRRIRERERRIKEIE
jgi:hypothetical protein